MLVLGKQKTVVSKKKKQNFTHTKQVELALSIAIILSNLSNDEEYIKTLLAVEKWRSREPSFRDLKLAEEAKEN